MCSSGGGEDCRTRWVEVVGERERGEGGLSRDGDRRVGGGDMRVGRGGVSAEWKTVTGEAAGCRRFEGRPAERQFCSNRSSKLLHWDRSGLK